MQLDLSTAKLNPVTIDGEQFTPSITIERRLRLAKTTADNELGSETLDAIAECFGEKKDEIRAKLDYLTVDAMCELQVYLLNGDKGVERYRNKVAA